jgi:hypothetical protein
MNTNTKHTPGPWRAEKDETAEVWDIKCNLGTVAMTDDLSPKTNEANARLIASAPELLEALKNLVSMGWNDSPLCKVYEKEIQAAEKAISQAEGGAQ